MKKPRAVRNRTAVLKYSGPRGAKGGIAVIRGYNQPDILLYPEDAERIGKWLLAYVKWHKAEDRKS